MKRIVLTTLLGLGIMTAAHSQRIKLGITGGASSTRLAGPRATSAPVPMWRLGVRGGAVAQVLLSSSGRLAVQTEVLYSGQGWRLDDGNGTVARQRLHYLQVPVLAQVKLATAIWLEAGPEVSYLLGSRTTTGPGGLLGTPWPIATDAVAFRRREVGYALGAGYQCSEHLRLGLRFTGGLTPVIKAAASGKMTAKKNRVMSLQATYLLGQ
ncbi:porin family protein [Hymenobacter endophyticus]|uniref:Porin family protein n=1 Tax=Hymenobacter endophyticus TaxID=3076335 RepID=A0ABU3TEB4_9BACT|nr:porin family protein [Hymenobacter endophyticus]MDU0369709.1 porin family protein [Hymenobacter endophyticus]